MHRGWSSKGIRQHPRTSTRRKPNNRTRNITSSHEPHSRPTQNGSIVIEEFVKRQGTISLDWYVPDFCNTWVGVLIKNRLPINTTRGRILFNCPPLREFFPTSTFELDLTTGQVYTFLTPPEDIGVPCQQEESWQKNYKKIQTPTDYISKHWKESL